VVMGVPSGGHIEITMVPMPVSLADPNSDAADPDMGTFGDDYLSPPVKEPASAGIVRSGTRNKANATFFMAPSFFGTKSVHR
jgi:hypothetical protein